MALNFPAKIYQILENESPEIIRWHPNGCAFRIVDHGRFEREIIPKYFRHNQISSVQRQLNLYGFKCISRGEDKGAFYHSKFRRGDWEVVKKITRFQPKKADNLLEDPTKPILLEEQINLMNPNSNSFRSTPIPTMDKSLNTLTAGASFQSNTNGNSSSSSWNPAYHHLTAPATSHYQHFPNPYLHGPFVFHNDFGFNYNSQQNNNNATPNEPANPPSHHLVSPHHYQSPPAAWHWPGTHYSNVYLPMKPIVESDFRPNDSSNNNNKTDQSSSIPDLASNINNNNDSSLSNNNASVLIASKPLSESSKSNSEMSSPTLTVKKGLNTASADAGYINVVNNALMIDPDFDLDEEFSDFFKDDDLAFRESQRLMQKQQQQLSASVVSGPRFCEIGVNTDITQAGYAAQQFYMR